MDTSGWVHQGSWELSEYVMSASLPECVSITHGKHESKSVQITKGDVVVLKSCDARLVNLTYRDEESGKRRDIDVSINCPQKFVVLPPKESSASRIVSIITYPSISDLVIDSPTYFEATSSCEDSNLNGTSINRGDRFRYRGVVTSPGDGEKRLKVIDREDNVVFLSFYCKGNFYPLEDDHCYTLRELVGFAPVPRRLKLAADDLRNISNTLSVDNQNSCQDQLKPSECVSSLPHDLPFPIKGVIHMLKPEMSVAVSPLNDPDTVWTIPVTADIHVRQYVLDDYEVPTKVVGKPLATPVPRHDSEAEEIPNFLAPSTPPLTQPLIPIKVNNFLDIYSNSLPVKGKIMDLSECSPHYKSMLSESNEITIYRVENTHRIYAEDVQSDAVYSLSKHAKVSFIEYPQKFNSISELTNLPVGTEIVILEDIASDFPKHFSLQFGDVIRIASNIPVQTKVKHSDLECKILKCERINKEKGSVTKLKLPIDFEVRMVISTDHNNQKIMTAHDLISGKMAPTGENVAALLDEGDNGALKILPPDLKNIRILPERLLITSLSVTDDSQSKKGQLKNAPSCFGISLNSGLVLAFRQRLEPSEVDRIVPEGCVAEQQLEILTTAQYEKRKQVCKMWVEEDEQENESVSSSDKCSISGDSLQRTDSTGVLDTKKVKKERDKIRRLSRALNPKHWRASKAVPDPLPHPEAMGLMALAVRPHYEKPNEYQTKLSHPSPSPSLDQTWSSFGNSSGEEDEKNIYEDVDIQPLKETQTSKSKPFTGRLHKSLPTGRVFPHGRRARGKASQTSSQDPTSKREERHKTSDLYSVSSKAAKLKDSQKNTVSSSYEDDDHVYEFPDGTFCRPSSSETVNVNRQSHDSQQDTARQKSPLIGLKGYVSPDTKPVGLEKHTGRKSTTDNSCELNVTVAGVKKSENFSPGTKPRTKKLQAIKSDLPENLPSRPVTSNMDNSSENISLEKKLRSTCIEKCTLRADMTESKDEQNVTADIDETSETEALSGKLSHSAGGKKSAEEPPVPPRRTKKINASTHVAAVAVEETHLSALYSRDTRNSKEVPNVEDLNKENLKRAEERDPVDGSDKVKDDITVKPPVPKPRGIKKSTQSKHVEDDIEKSANVPVSLKTEETAFPQNDVHEGTERLPVIRTSAVLPQKTPRGNARPKLPPKPRLTTPK